MTVYNLQLLKTADKKTGHLYFTVPVLKVDGLPGLGEVSPVADDLLR